MKSIHVGAGPSLSVKFSSNICTLTDLIEFGPEYPCLDYCIEALNWSTVPAYFWFTHSNVVFVRFNALKIL